MAVMVSPGMPNKSDGTQPEARLASLLAQGRPGYLPSLILSPLWVWAVSAEIAAWRLLEAETHPREHFDPLWKLAYMWEHPLLLPASTYIVLTVLLLVAMMPDGVLNL
jgi:hypothetical protein